jgi:hypothetical protein
MWHRYSLKGVRYGSDAYVSNRSSYGSFLSCYKHLFSETHFPSLSSSNLCLHFSFISSETYLFPIFSVVIQTVITSTSFHPHNSHRQYQLSSDPYFSFFF